MMANFYLSLSPCLLQATETATHTWTVYLRSPLNQNLGQIIKKVTFNLHDSFANPNRDVKSPPFELSENGWGEFDILIEVRSVTGMIWVRPWPM